jgi:DNA-binding transcriptional LysR family regulator
MRRRDSPQGRPTVDTRARLGADDNLTLHAAALAADGIAKPPRYVADGALSAGQLAEVLPAYPAPDSWFRAHVTQHRAQAARIVALTGWLQRALKTALPKVRA